MTVQAHQYPVVSSCSRGLVAWVQKARQTEELSPRCVCVSVRGTLGFHRDCLYLVG